jgi:predicted ATPase/DNA-binding SARP family transcriptional activator
MSQPGNNAAPRFLILGPLEVVGGRGPIRLGGAKRRGLVALLVANAGQRLSTDAIVEHLWGTADAPGAARTVQTYVSQLRRDLANSGWELVADRGGYLLEIPPDSLDASYFEQLVREAGDVTDTATRLRLLDEALALWRGTPLEEFADEPWTTPIRTRLELLRLQAVEQQIEARLALGRHHELIGELEALVIEHPLDERLWASLLVAYYRSGRQADALRAYQRLRTTLADDLGIDPNPELAALERRILDQDETLLHVPVARVDAPPAELPGGTVTFLFTDVGDSTRLWESRTDEMAKVIARHDQLVTAAVAHHDGWVVKSVGDGVMAVFARAADGVAAAVSIQRDVADEDWPVPIAVRIGLHTGVADAVDGDYHAPAVNRAARVAAAAHPEQILVTSATAALTEEWEMRDLGEHELRGLSPTRLFQVTAPGLREDFTPLATRHYEVDLPVPPTTFVGRDTELAAVSDLLRDHRLVTITGAGGSGKTRLALEAATRLAPDFADGVYFADLATAVTDEQATDAVADALGLSAGSESPEPRGRIAAFLAERHVLCVVDNCEHLLDATADLAESVLAQPGESRLVATSREPLGVMGEQVFVVPSLEIATEAVRLFADRAAEARAGFEVDDGSRALIGEICQRLDGIPLAIELAAASVTHLSPAQVLERLDDRFRVLTGGRRRVERHQTLAATLDWSHDLLSSDEQQVLRRLAAFPGTFSLEAAEAVARVDLATILGSLVAKSLVQVVDAGDRLRYRLLETVRLYCEAKLADAGEAETFRARHRDWILGWLESIPLEERWLGDVDYLAAEQASIRAALDWSSDEGDSTAVAKLASSVDWSRSEAWREARRRCKEVVAAEIPDDVRLRVLVMLWWFGPLSSGDRVWGKEAIDLSEGTESALRALDLVGHGLRMTVPAIDRRDEELGRRALEWTEAGVAMSEKFSDPWRACCRFFAGNAHASHQGGRGLGKLPVDLARTNEHFRAGLEVSPRAAPYLNLRAAIAGVFAITLLIAGDAGRALDLARGAYGDSQPLRPGALFPYWQHARGMALAVTLGETGDDGGARRALREYLESMRRTDWGLGLQSVLILGGVLAAQRGDPETAARLFGAGAPALRRTPSDGLLYITYRDRVRALLGSDRARALRDEGRSMTLDDALSLVFR